ncbi:glycosyltransferase family 2 protein (plasmid) [Paraburkholderia strydomiana]
MVFPNSDNLSDSERPHVVAVIVTFNPDIPTLQTMLESLQAQVSRTVIVDNGSAGLIAEQIEQLALRHVCVLESLQANLGIAAAQNRGLAVAMRVEFDRPGHHHYVLFLDHDSIPASQMVEKLVATDVKLRRQNVRVGAVGPVVIDRRTGTHGRFVRAGRLWLTRVHCADNCSELAVDFLISSGTLVRADVFQEVGGMNEGLFIDHVDTDWCLRVSAAKYRLFAVCGAHLTHSLGDEVVKVWLGRWREIFVHSPIRDYYMCRNTLLILKAIQMPLAWRLFLIVRLIGSIVFFGLGMAPRWTRLRRMFQGLLDGVNGRSGVLNVS